MIYYWINKVNWEDKKTQKNKKNKQINKKNK